MAHFFSNQQLRRGWLALFLVLQGYPRLTNVLRGYPCSARPSGLNLPCYRLLLRLPVYCLPLL